MNGSTITILANRRYESNADGENIDSNVTTTILTNGIASASWSVATQAFLFAGGTPPDGEEVSSFSIQVDDVTDWNDGDTFQITCLFTGTITYYAKQGTTVGVNDQATVTITLVGTPTPDSDNTGSGAGAALPTNLL